MSSFNKVIKTLTSKFHLITKASTESVEYFLNLIFLELLGHILY